MTTQRLSNRQFLLWKEYKEDNNEEEIINPKTGKMITVGGKIYKEIEVAWQKMVKNKLVSQKTCEEWDINRNVNPRTRRKITPTGEIYKFYEKECEIYLKPQEYTFEEQKGRQNVSDKIWMTLCRSGDQDCMMKGCPWSGKFGINPILLPKIVQKTIAQYTIKARCCCFCFGHFLMFTAAITSKVVSAICVPRDIKDILNVQRVVDKIESNDNKSEKIFSQELESQYNKAVGNMQSYVATTFLGEASTITQSILTEMSKYSQSNYTLIRDGIIDAISLFNCS